MKWFFDSSESTKIICSKSPIKTGRSKYYWNRPFFVSNTERCTESHLQVKEATWTPNIRPGELRRLKIILLQWQKDIADSLHQSNSEAPSTITRPTKAPGWFNGNWSLEEGKSETVDTEEFYCMYVHQELTLLAVFQDWYYVVGEFVCR